MPPIPPKLSSRMVPLSVVLVAALTAGGLTQSAGVRDAPARARAATSLLSSTPFVRLFTEASSCGDNRKVNELKGRALTDRLTELTRWYRHFHGEASTMFSFGYQCRGSSATTLATKLAARGAMVSNYRNGSYVSQSRIGLLNDAEAADIESTAPLGIATFWAGNPRRGKTGDNSPAARVSGSLSATASIVSLTTAASEAPSGAPASWPYDVSRGTGLRVGARSRDTHNFVSWVRVEDEIMQIVAPTTVAAGTDTVTVRRGAFGTRAVPHPAGTRAMSPVYVGGRAAMERDSNLSGVPERNDIGFPLRYAVEYGQPEGYGWIARQIRRSFDPRSDGSFQGYNAVWLDVSGCGTYSNADVDGNAVTGWDSIHSTGLTQTQILADEQAKIAGLRRLLPKLALLGNSFTQQRAPASLPFNVCSDKLLGQGFDGASLEDWMKWAEVPSFNWAAQQEQSFRIQAENWPAEYWVRWNYGFHGDENQYKRFSYGSLLLAYRPTATQFQFGGPFGVGPPDRLYFWNWGAPLALPARVADVSVPGTPLYRRYFQFGTVVVNPSVKAFSLDLGATFLDVVHTDARGNPSPVTRVTVGAHDAAFLLRSGS